jgi:hypothetical protein
MLHHPAAYTCIVRTLYRERKRGGGERDKEMHFACGVLHLACARHRAEIEMYAYKQRDIERVSERERERETE